MPTRRKNVDLGRVKRPSKKSKLSDYFSSAYVQYLMIFLIWGALLLINQSTEMRFEYFWPGWLFICSIHDSLKYQGLQYTIVFIIIVITMDLICFFLVPASWIYSCGSAYVWVYLLWYTDQGLWFLTLTFCFIFVYFELGFYSREAKLNHSIYLFRPFAAHSIGYPVVCMGFSIKRYLDMRHRKFKKLDVRRQNCVYFRILREAIPPTMLAECSGIYSCAYLPDDIPDSNDINGDDIPSNASRGRLPWSLFLVMQLCKSLCSRVTHWTPFHAMLRDKECNGSSSLSYTRQNGMSNNSNAPSHVALSGPSSSTGSSLAPVDSIVRRGANSDIQSGSNHRRFGADNAECQGKTAGVSTKACTPAKSRPAKEDLNTRLENSIRRLRTEVQSMRAVEAQLRGQLTQLERDDRLNRLSLSNQRQENESLASRIGKLTTRSRNERSNLANVEQSLIEEKRARQALEEQLVEVISHKEVETISSNEVASGSGHGKAVQVSPDLFSMPGSEPERVIEAPCCQRRHRLESEVYTLRVASRRQDEQLRALSGARARQANHNQQQISRINESGGHSAKQTVAHGDSKVKSLSMPAKDTRATEADSSDDVVMHSHREQLMLETYLQLASEERERLANTLREENWMKQELLTAYHTSVREITELNKTHKQRDLQILELTMKIEQLECLAVSSGGRAGRAGKKDSSTTSPPMTDRSENLKMTDSRVATSLSLDYPISTSQMPLFSYYSGEDVVTSTSTNNSGAEGFSGLGQTPLDRFSHKLRPFLPVNATTIGNGPNNGSSSPISLDNSAAVGSADTGTTTPSSSYGDRLHPGGADSMGRSTSFPFTEMGCAEMATNSLSAASITARLSAETH